MRLLPPSPGELTRTYEYEGSEGWFGKHHQQVRTQFYYFLNGKFCRFMALGDPTVLRPEATYLVGPGQAEGKYRLFWEGSRARAAYREQASGMGMEGQFDVLSKALEAEQAAQDQAQLKARLRTLNRPRVRLGLIDCQVPTWANQWRRDASGVGSS